MSTKFEKLLDYLVNEDHEKANELFHEIVVEKSRNIYENLIAEEEEEEEVDESMEDDEEEVDESMEELEDSYEMEADDDGGFDASDTDATGDLGTDIAADDDMDDDDMDDDDMDDDMGGEADEDQAIMDIKNAIKELEAAFSELERAHDEEEGDEFGDEDEEGDEFGDEDEEGDEFGDEEDADEMFEGRRVTREFIELPKIGNDWDKGSQHTDGDIVGANTGEQMPKAKSGEAKTMKWGNGKPTSSATAKNLAQGAQEGQKNTGTTPNKVNKGITPEKSGKYTETDWEGNSKPGNAKARKLTPVQGAHGLAKGSASDTGSEGTAVGAGSGYGNSVTGATNTKPLVTKKQ